MSYIKYLYMPDKQGNTPVHNIFFSIILVQFSEAFNFMFIPTAQKS